MFPTIGSPGGTMTAEIPTGGMNGQTRIGDLNGGTTAAYIPSSFGTPAFTTFTPGVPVGFTPAGTFNPLYGIPTGMVNQPIAPYAYGQPTYGHPGIYGIPTIGTPHTMFNPFLTNVPFVTNPFVNNAIPATTPFGTFPSPIGYGVTNPYMTIPNPINLIPTGAIPQTFGVPAGYIPAPTPTYFNPFLGGVTTAVPRIGTPIMTPFGVTTINPNLFPHNAYGTPTVNPVPFVHPAAVSPAACGAQPVTAYGVQAWPNAAGLPNVVRPLDGVHSTWNPVNPFVNTAPPVIGLNPWTTASCITNPWTTNPWTTNPWNLAANLTGGVPWTQFNPWIGNLGGIIPASTPTWNTGIGAALPGVCLPNAIWPNTNPFINGGILNTPTTGIWNAAVPTLGPVTNPWNCGPTCCI